MEYMKNMGDAARVFFEKVEENFRLEPEQPYKAGYNTTNRYFALNGLGERVSELVEFLESYGGDPEDEEQEFVFHEYEGLLNDLRRWRKTIAEDVNDVRLDEDLERANEYL